jgi:penicillin amidase
MSRLTTQLTSLLSLLFLGGCSLLKPFPLATTTEERLATFPTMNLDLRGEVDIYWDDHQIPFISATHDDDIPYVMGLVHAHLRLGQMEVLRRVSQGRLAEMFGPYAVDIDHSLRILNHDRVVPELEKNLPDETRAWLDRYLAGINHFIENGASLPPELDSLGITPTPWSRADVLGVGRLAASDVNWLYWFMNMRMRGEPAWKEVWQRQISHGRIAHPSYGDKDDALNLLGSAVRSGSNALVVAGSRSDSGGALVAGDPHLGLMLPNFWVIIGCHAPSYRVVGLSMPGLPAVLVGRNEQVGWAGTNMLALSTTFYDLSGDNDTSYTERTERIQVRWWRDKEVTIRESELGPVISDAPLLEDYDLPEIAVKWRGHLPSDELTPFLRANRAADWEEFREAFRGYGVSGQNILFGDSAGNIGQLAALSFAPAAGVAAPEFFADPANPDHQWATLLDSTELPFALNPEQGFLASTNNAPTRTEPPLSLFGNSNDRITAFNLRMAEKERFSTTDLMAIQQDVYAQTSHQLAQAIITYSPTEIDGADDLLDALEAWDGRYTRESNGAVALELVAYYLASRAYEERYGPTIRDSLMRSAAIYGWLLEDLITAPETMPLAEAITDAAADFDPATSWGEVHVLRLTHALGNVPVIGGKYRFGEFEVGGSTNTIMKRAHSLSNTKRRVTYGAQSRHISDMADPDANYFVLVGGQDGFWGSENYLDLYTLWQRGEYVQVPLRLTTAQHTFPHKLTLRN